MLSFDNQNKSNFAQKEIKNSKKYVPSKKKTP